MSADLQTLEKDAQALRAAIDAANVQEAKQQLTKLKIALTTLPSLPPCAAPSATATQERTLARHVLESATMLSVLSEDMASFERSVIQLKVYYGSLATELGPSPLHYPILGTRLLQLLVENRMAEFHNELELIPEQAREDPNIAFGIKLEQYLMEGSYNKVLEARANVPNPFFKFFLSQLLQTVRENIADCAEIAYQCLELSDAQKMLIFDSAAELNAYIQERKPEWVVRDNHVWFKAPEKNLGASDIPSLKLVGETLSYATELDRIV
uniref:PCI domain-containing protein n=1 Tax=Globisporangium ultimum (strain ATCC 200006 / CBS 805.95 / DAOM BR144) TaxID=431595 RepID=K3X1Q6_GLOUD